MPKYTVRLSNTTVWDVEVEASDEEQAYRETIEWGRDDLADDEQVSNHWDIEVWGSN